jgi:hypothetical protein
MGKYLTVRQTAAHKRVGHDFWWWYVLMRPAMRVLLMVGLPAAALYGLWSAVPHPLLAGGCAAGAAGCVALVATRRLSMAGVRARLMGTATPGTDVALGLAGLVLTALAVLIFRAG